MSLTKSSPKIERLPSGRVKITHSQSVRSSANYQSAEVSFGIEVEVENDPKAIRRATDQAEEFVERRLVTKVQEQQKLLKVLGKNHR